MDPVEDVIASLSLQLEAADEQELAGEVAEQLRYQHGRVTLRDRLVASLLCGLTLRGPDVDVTGVLTAVGDDYLVVEPVTGRSTLVPISAVSVVGGLRGAAAPAEERSSVRDDVRRALRALARDRAIVDVSLAGGHRVSGRIARVGADYVELTVDGRGSCVPLTAVRSITWFG